MKLKMTDAERFFDKVIKDYNCGDIAMLLGDRTTALGPLLSAVAAGIDTVGGMMYGFTENGGGNSRPRSVRFLEQILKFNSVAATVIYTCARCGYVHEGLSKLGVRFFADYDRVKPEVVLFRMSDGKLGLNVAELAYMYLDGIKHVWNNCRAQLQHLPSASKQDARLATSIQSLLPTLEDFDKYFDGEERGSHSQEDVLNEVTFWGNDGYE